MSGDPTQPGLSDSSHLSVSTEQRRLLFERILRNLSRGPEVLLAVHIGESNKAERIGHNLWQELGLVVNDLGWRDPADDDLEARAVQLRLAARALRREIEKQGPPPPDGDVRSTAYRAETLELLHGPPPPIRLDGQERELLLRMANVSLEEESAQDHNHAVSIRRELKALLDDLALVEKTDFPYLVTKLPIPRFLAWLDRWFDDLRGKGPDASSDVEVVRGIGNRIEQDWEAQDDAGAGKSILPRAAM